MNLLTFDGYTPTSSPSKYDISYQNVMGDDSFVSESGHELINMVRGGVRSISVEYSNLKTSELELIKSKLIKETISVTFYDGTYMTAVFKSLNPAVKMITLVDGGYWNLAFELKEL